MSDILDHFPYVDNNRKCLGNRILETVSDAIITIDLKMTIRSWNSAAGIIYGWRGEETIGKNFLDFFVRPAQRQRFENAFFKRVSKGTWNFDTRQYTKDKKALAIHCSVNALYDNNGRLTGFVLVNRDKTRRKNAEKELKRQNDLLKAIAWTQAHKVRSPVATILGLSYIFNKSIPCDPLNEEILGHIQKTAIQLDLVIREIVAKSSVGYIEEQQSTSTYKN